MYSLYRNFVYEPLYNGLVFFISILPPWANAAMAIIILTVVVRLILFPLAKRTIRTQLVMKELEPKLREIKEKYKKREEQSLAIMQLYREKKLNPFSGFFLLLIQFPIIIALYSIFVSGLPEINTAILYPFIHAPEIVDMHLFGIDLSSKSLILAFVVAITQYIQLSFAIPKQKPEESRGLKGPEEMVRNMQNQMKFIFPVLIFIIAFPFPPFSYIFPTLPAAVVLYWIVSNIFMTGQEIVIRKRLSKVKNS